MQTDWGAWAVASLALVLGNALFVATEYALISARRSRIAALARRGDPAARRLQAALEDLSTPVAGIQIGVTLTGVGVGVVTEPVVGDALRRALGGLLPLPLVSILSVLLVSLSLVIAGELVPKYLALRYADPIALAAIRPLALFVAVFRPLVALTRWVAHSVLRLLGVSPEDDGAAAMTKDELALLVRAGAEAGEIAKAHADVVAKSLNLDLLTAEDIMVHRMDIRWIPADLDAEQARRRLAEIPFSRVPVCGEDIDDIVGILYLHDFLAHMDDRPFDLRALARPAVFVPENLSLDRIVARMREERTQLLIVTDEYGGTSGLVTLEDVVEEVFGDLEDRLESERPAIEFLPSGRVSVRADVRMDELAEALGVETQGEPCTDTLAEVVVNALGRVPSVGDRVRTELGVLRVDNMARRRITRLSLLRR